MSVVSIILYVLLGLVSVFLILLVLIQRGKGGGLAGALGGMGGSSAFGTRAGDLFTRITLVVAGFWILAAMGLAWINANVTAGRYDNPAATVPVPDEPPLTGGAAPPDEPAPGESPAAPAEPDARFVPTEPGTQQPVESEAPPETP